MIQIASQQQMKYTNTRHVLELIRTNERISRADIAKMTRLSPTTISSIVEELLRKGIVVEKHPMQTKGVGRKAISLEMNDVGKYIIGMEINQHTITATAFNLKKEPLETVSEPIKLNDEGVAHQLIDSMLNTVNKVMKSVRRKHDELLGLCIGVPALLDADKKSIVSSTVLHVTDLDLHRIFKEKFDFPIFIEDETLLAATAEVAQFERGTNPFIYLSINDGLGASVIINGKYLQGANGDSLEIGHMSLDMNGEPCPCGNRGCFELHVSVGALAHKTAEAARTHPDSVIHPFVKAGSMPLEQAVAEAVRLGDPAARQIVDEMAIDLGNGIVNLINIFNPQTVVIGGRLSVLGERLRAGAVRQVEKRAFKSFRDRCSVELARQTENTVSCGAAIYVLDKVLEQQINEAL